MSESDEQNERKSRKRQPDLKAVAALIDDQHDDSSSQAKAGDKSAIYEPDSELIETTGRIKNQRDLIRSRLLKMEMSRTKVSRAVYEKVFRDYTLQLESISQLLTDKKTGLKKELKNLYTLLEKKTLEVSRHREILEEARFRHFLEEFTEDQYKEVEDYESREISQLQNDMAQLQSFIRVHEELFDPEDLGRQAVAPEPVARESIPTPSEVEPTHTMAAPSAPALPEPDPLDEFEAALEASAQASAQAPEAAFPSIEDIFSDQTPPPDVAAIASAEMALGLSDAPVVSETAPVTQEAGDYFDPAATDSRIPRMDEPAEANDEEAIKSEATLIRSLSEIAIPGAPEALIRDRNEIEPESAQPLNKEPSETHSQAAASLTGTSAPVQATDSSKPAAARMVFIESEGPLDVNEFILTDNVSIGRSPSNDMVLKAPKVSRQHAAINKYKDQYLIIDLKSSNGVFVNGRKIDEHELQEGDEVSVGGYKMIFKKG